jgi:hypothetical protein
MALIGAYLLLIRPWHLTWGATDEEVRRPMPGDGIHATPSFSGTRAVTVEAGPEHIWPWLVQMGYRRAGFYSYDRLDNDGIPSADQIISEYQSLKVGDRVPMAASAYAEVLEMDPPHSMLWVFRGKGQWENATWAWGLYEEDAGHTRLVSRAIGEPAARPLQVGPPEHRPDADHGRGRARDDARVPARHQAKSGEAHEGVHVAACG